MFPGIDMTTIDHLFSFEQMKGMVLETYGSGNVTNRQWFINAIKKIVDRGIPVVNVTQCSGGSVNMGMYDTSAHLKKIGVIS